MIEGPPVPLPSPELAHLHFNDKLLYYMMPLESSPQPEDGRDASPPVDCTVFAPPAAAAGGSIVVQLFVHLPQQADEAIELGRDFDESARRLGFSSLETEIPRGSRPQVELTLPGLEISEPVQNFVWRGSAESIQFAVRVPHSQKPGNLIGKVTVSLRGGPIGHICFRIAMGSSSEMSPPIEGESS